jgi:predicted DCC family thiol-disulfide oxidoreductase YuxK
MSAWKFKVLYDGHCPYCRLEVRWLQYWNRKGHLAFDDISAESFTPGSYGVTLDDLMASIHGVSADGRLVQGVEVFRQAYSAVGIGWILAPTGWPLLRPVFDLLYSLFARYRVSLGKLIGRKCEHGTCSLKTGKQTFAGDDQAN